jgi:hypothetical protein
MDQIRLGGLLKIISINVSKENQKIKYTTHHRRKQQRREEKFTNHKEASQKELSKMPSTKFLNKQGQFSHRRGGKNPRNENNIS